MEKKNWIVRYYLYIERDDLSMNSHRQEFIGHDREYVEQEAKKELERKSFDADKYEIEEMPDELFHALSAQELLYRFLIRPQYHIALKHMHERNITVHNDMDVYIYYLRNKDIYAL